MHASSITLDLIAWFGTYVREFVLFTAVTPSPQLGCLSVQLLSKLNEWMNELSIMVAATVLLTVNVPDREKSVFWSLVVASLPPFQRKS